ncbi:coiled-coil domain-containing protein 71 isoform X2 [Hyla sarda]|uniref:coiled-coil domain-containing protein 71 isoform X2 n=1 Tax=Hyla sarda TaxID=327740 RepID=UPI0024C2ECAD|nr:coiled-coil domain-containing protein 71 isoform X2 [Hyla sarda]
MDVGGRHRLGRKRNGISGAQRGGHFLCRAAEAVLGCHQGERETVPERRRRKTPERWWRRIPSSTSKSQQTLQPNAMNVQKSQMEEKAVHSWSRLSSAGKSAFEEALRVFNPMSKDLTDTETQLVTFLQGLREEGYQPTILSSKDVYGYNSTTADTPPPPPTAGPKCPPKSTSAVSSSRSHSKNQIGKPGNTRVDISVNAAKISSKHSNRNSASRNLLLTSLKHSDTEKTKRSCVEFPSDMYPDVFPAMKLSVVLEALVPFKATASSLASLKEQPLIIASKQNAKGKNNKAYQSLIKGNSSLNGINGKILKENDACKAFEILNGRFLVNPHPHCNGMAQTRHNSKLQTDVTNKDTKLGDRDKKRKLSEVSEEAPVHKRIQITLPLVKRSPFDKDKYNLLKSTVIKIDKTSSDEEVRRKAQKILRVNLSPVLRIQPLFVSLQ